MNYINNKYSYIFLALSSISTISYYYYKKNKNNTKKIEIKDNFLNYFPITQDEINESKILNKDRDYKDFKEKIINYSVPNKGDIYFNYNDDEKIFEYWTDIELNYRELETVTRKFCIEYNCRELYIDRKYEFQNQKELLEKIKQQQQKKNNNNNDVFVKLKDYNTKKNNNIIVLKDTIKFKKKGKISDYNEMLEKKKKDENTVKNKKISYKDFKNKIR